MTETAKIRNTDARTYELVFGEARSSLTRQEAAVDELRSRTSWLIGAVALISSFLGSVALDDGRVGCFGVAAAVSFVVGIVLSSIVMWPWHWTFALGADELLDEFVENKTRPATIAEVHREVALQLEDYVTGNGRALRRLYWVFAGLIVTIGLQVAFWLLELALNPNPVPG